MREFDWFIVRLAEGRACAEAPVGFKYYDALHRAVCGGELADFDAGPGPYYPIVLAAHHLWRRGDVCAACALLGKLRGKKPHGDEATAARLLEAAVREGAEGVRRIEAEDGPWSWASLFKDLLTAELDPRERVKALRRIRRALKLVEEASADLTDEIIEGYNIILPPKTPYIYIGHAALKLERHEASGHSAKNLLSRILFRRQTRRLHASVAAPTPRRRVSPNQRVLQVRLKKGGGLGAWVRQVRDCVVYAVFEDDPGVDLLRVFAELSHSFLKAPRLRAVYPLLHVLHLAAV
jgi:hypothetical protein